MHPVYFRYQVYFLLFLFPVSYFRSCITKWGQSMSNTSSKVNVTAAEVKISKKFNENLMKAVLFLN